MDIEEYAEHLLQETLAAAEVEGTSRLEAFTQLVIERLVGAGEIDDGTVAYFRATGLEISGWAADSGEDVLHVFVTEWSGIAPPSVLQLKMATTSLRRLSSFVGKCVSGYGARLEESSPIWEFADLLPLLVPSLAEIRLYLFSDSISRTANLPQFDALVGVPVTTHIWDLERLYRLDTSGLEREPITVDVVGMLRHPLPCLAAPPAKDHEVYLAVLPGRFLADLYGRFGSRLLERNVRSFLQARGGVNKGIRETIGKEPDRFLPYNNGISATAAEVSVVHLEGGGIGLTEIRDLQIVNGGQTTASIHHAAAKLKADLSEVSVQAKLTVVNSDLIDELVPYISRFSNTQNKVTGADFSANHAFHIRIEEFSRTVWAPAPDGTQRQTRWFYERARGQYADEVARAGTPAKQKLFKTTCPTRQKFTKPDLAKFVHTWEQRPHVVSLGAEKNFRDFMVRLAERTVDPDLEWFKRLVAKAILFRAAERIVQDQHFGGYRAQIVTFTLAKLVHETQSRLDLDLVWRQQRLSAATEAAIADLSHPIHGVITNPSGPVRHIGEWSKKLDCWKAVEELRWDVPPILAMEIGRSDNVASAALIGDQALPEMSPWEQRLVEQVASVSAEAWFAISKWAKATNNLQGWQRSLSFSLGQRAAQGRAPTVKQARQGRSLHNEAARLGFQVDSLEEFPVE